MLARGDSVYFGNFERSRIVDVERRTMRITVSVFFLLGLVLCALGEPIERTEEDQSVLDCVFEDNTVGCLRTRLARDIDQVEMQVTGRKSEPPMSAVIEQTSSFMAEVVDGLQNPETAEETKEDTEVGEQGENHILPIDSRRGKDN